MTFSFLLSYFLLLLPVFGKAINYSESILLYGGTIFLLIFSIFNPPLRQLQKKFVIYQLILVLLSIFSTVFSKNISFSYYGLFNFIFSLIIINMSLCYLDVKKTSKLLTYFSLTYSSIFLLNKYKILTLSLDRSFDDFLPQVWGHSYLADFLIFTIPFLLYKIIYSKSHVLKLKNIFYILSLIFIFIALLLTNSRSAVVALSISTIYIVYPKISKYFRPIFICLIVSFVIFFCYQTLIKNPNIKSVDGNRLEYWHESLKAFIDRPVFGHGLGNFFYINKQYQNIPFTNTNYAHNSFFEFLCLNGLPFTIFFFSIISSSLIYQYQKKPLSFIIALTATINSFFDPSWNSIGIFCISLFYILSENPSFTKKVQLPYDNKNNYLKILVIIIISLFFISKTTSDYLFITNRYSLSIHTDPFNINPRLADLNNNLSSTILLNKNNPSLYISLINNTIPNQNNEKYYSKLIEINPKENISIYSILANYYFDSKNFTKLSALLSSIDKNIVPSNHPISETLPIAKIAYNLAINKWNSNQLDLSIDNLKLATKFSQGWSHFHIELANAYWHNNKKYLAQKQIEKECLKYPNSKKHCLEYLDTYRNYFLQPGTNDFLNIINSLP